MTPESFVAKWSKSELKERSACQEHFLDLCRLVGHPNPQGDALGLALGRTEAGQTLLGRLLALNRERSKGSVV